MLAIAIDMKIGVLAVMAVYTLSTESHINTVHIAGKNLKDREEKRSEIHFDGRTGTLGWRRENRKRDLELMADKILKEKEIPESYADFCYSVANTLQFALDKLEIE